MSVTLPALHPPAHGRLTVDEVMRMADAGGFDENPRVELIEGELIPMSPISDRHAWFVDFLNNEFKDRLGRSVFVRGQNPLVLNPRGMPQPDVMLLRLPRERYRKSHPTPADVLLLVEVADTSLRFDRKTKLTLYADAGITEVWIADVAREELWIYRAPQGGRYAEERRIVGGDEGEFSPLAFPEVKFTRADFGW